MLQLLLAAIRCSTGKLVLFCLPPISFFLKEIFVGRVELELEYTSIGLGYWREATRLI